MHAIQLIGYLYREPLINVHVFFLIYREKRKWTDFKSNRIVYEMSSSELKNSNWLFDGECFERMLDWEKRSIDQKLSAIGINAKKKINIY